MNVRNILTKLAMVLLLLPLLANAQALRIQVEGVARPTPVAVVPFGWEGDPSAAPLQLADVVSADLYRSGRFDPLEERKM
ncbi:MAG: Tol-Pal system protein TolB, partial [Pseudomonadota bacterium]